MRGPDPLPGQASCSTPRRRDHRTSRVRAHDRRPSEPRSSAVGSQGQRRQAAHTHGRVRAAQSCSSAATEELIEGCCGAPSSGAYVAPRSVSTTGIALHLGLRRTSHMSSAETLTQARMATDNDRFGSKSRGRAGRRGLRRARAAVPPSRSLRRTPQAAVTRAATQSHPPARPRAREPAVLDPDRPQQPPAYRPFRLRQPLRAAPSGVLRFAPALRVTEAKPGGGGLTGFILRSGLIAVGAFLPRARLRRLRAQPRALR
jgi:hypothetical protein